MNSRTHMTKTNLFTLLVLGVLGVSLFSLIVMALPEGPVIVNKGNSSKAASGGTASTVQKGTINYVDLSATQQNNRWKAYVGNVTGVLVLQDSAGFSIYDWTLSTSLTGNIYATRNITVNWAGNISCATTSNLSQEESLLQFSSSGSDNIQNTFGSRNHTLFNVNLIPLFNCSTVYTFESNARQQANASNNTFQEIIAQDNSSGIIYTTRVAQDGQNYKGNGNLSDFQMLLPDYGNLSNTNTITYYFYVELT